MFLRKSTSYAVVTGVKIVNFKDLFYIFSPKISHYKGKKWLFSRKSLLYHRQVWFAWSNRLFGQSKLHFHIQRSRHLPMRRTNSTTETRIGPKKMSFLAFWCFILKRFVWLSFYISDLCSFNRFLPWGIAKNSITGQYSTPANLRLFGRTPFS